MTIGIFLCSILHMSNGQNMHQLLMALQNMGEGGGQNILGNFGTGKGHQQLITATFVI